MTSLFFTHKGSVRFGLRVVLLLLCVIFFGGSGAATVRADESEDELPDLSSVGSCVLYNIDSASIMFEQNGNERMYPTATVKLMVAYTAYAFLSERLDETVTVPKEVITQTTGVSMELRTDERIPVRDLFSGLVISGANDAALTLALECCGNVEVFLQYMNETAVSLGMADTYYVNVTGIDNVLSYTTARDVLRLSVAFYEVEFLRDLASTPILELDSTNKHAARTLHTRNYLLSRRIYPYYYMPEASGLNAGSTAKGGNCTVACATLHNVRYLCVVLGGSDVEGTWEGESVKLLSSFSVAKELLQWGDTHYEYRTVVSPMNVYGEISVELSGSGDYVTAVPLERVQIFVAKNSSTADHVMIETELFYETLTAPVTEGMEVGRITVIRTQDGEIIGQTALVTKNSVNISQWLYIGSKLLEIVRTDAFAIVVGVFLLGSVVGVLVTARLRYLRQRRAALRRQMSEEEL